MVTRSVRSVLGVCFVILSAVPALAQSDPDRFELGAQLAVAKSSEFNATDIGFGGRFSWNPIGLLGVESEITFYPSAFPDASPFSRARIEGLFGATVGPRIGLVRPFAKARAGFLNVRAASRPFACILIFPPPLSCELGAGRTLPSFDFGGGLELLPSSRTFVRGEIGARVLRYPGPAMTSSGPVLDQSFFNHDFRVAAGAGLRF